MSRAADVDWFKMQASKPPASWPSRPHSPAIVSIWAFANDMKEHEELEATTSDGVHYHFIKWRGQLWIRKWDHVHQEYHWVLYRESD